MVKLWRRYKPFINAGVQELITYRVNFILYRIGDVMGAFVAFYLWKAVFDSSQDSLIQGFSMADITLYIIMSFVTNLLTKSDSSFVFEGDVLINITGASIGRCFYIESLQGEVNVNQHVCIDCSWPGASPMMNLRVSVLK